ncbi:MAG: ABC transporter substrate-binding protein [Marinobacter sp.]|uniref:ABC transporter substrate-binding protein n=1 Tax=Marinobacter sp. TaxID=50741 RepID=UPI00299EA844|nr:ABC transporter substrate-binding protein [Marinobacter sp.]MDX1634556.1 ABC transporter substrate-binding protein [Marinobacter sp.]
MLWAFLLLLLFDDAAMAQSDTGAAGIPSYSTSLLIAGSGNAAFNARFTTLLKERLGREVEILPYSPELSRARPDTPVIALGPQALSRVQDQQPRPPTLALMVTEDQFEGYQSRQGAALSAVYHNPPLLQQALLGKLILPQSTRVALLVQPGEEASFDDLIKALADFGLQARVFIVAGDDSLIATLSRALSYGDFLLAQPDTVIYNPRTIKHILLTAYRRNRIVIGPNQAFVNAGALASIYTPISTVIDETVAALQAYKATGELPPPAYPSALDVQVNQQVARSLNIPLPDTSYLTERLNETFRQGKEGSP